MITENEFSVVFEQGYQEGWGEGLIYGLMLGCATAGLIGLAVMFVLK